MGRYNDPDMGAIMRVQVLDLPGSDGERPFALLFDECPPTIISSMPDWHRDLKADSGARVVMVFTETVTVL